MTQKLKGAGTRKYGRNQAFCQAYKGEQRREKSKARKLAKHIRRAPWDQCARKAFDALPALATKGHALPERSKSPTTLRGELGITLTQEQRGILIAA